MEKYRGFPDGSVVKNLPSMQETKETQAAAVSWEDPLEKGMATHSSIPAWRIPMDRGAWWATVHGLTESDMTELLSRAHNFPKIRIFSVSQGTHLSWNPLKTQSLQSVS